MPCGWSMQQPCRLWGSLWPYWWSDKPCKVSVRPDGNCTQPYRLFIKPCSTQVSRRGCPSTGVYCKAGYVWRTLRGLLWLCSGRVPAHVSPCSNPALHNWALPLWCFNMEGNICVSCCCGNQQVRALSSAAQSGHQTCAARLE